MVKWANFLLSDYRPLVVFSLYKSPFFSTQLQVQRKNEFQLFYFGSSSSHHIYFQLLLQQLMMWMRFFFLLIRFFFHFPRFRWESWRKHLSNIKTHFGKRNMFFKSGKKWNCRYSSYLFLQYRIKYNVCCGSVIVTGNKHETPSDVDRVLQAFSAFEHACFLLY